MQVFIPDFYWYLIITCVSYGNFVFGHRQRQNWAALNMFVRATSSSYLGQWCYSIAFKQNVKGCWNYVYINSIQSDFFKCKLKIVNKTWISINYWSHFHKNTYDADWSEVYWVVHDFRPIFIVICFLVKSIQVAYIYKIRWKIILPFICLSYI